MWLLPARADIADAGPRFAQMAARCPELSGIFCNNDMLAIKGREKEGKWFASPSNRNKFLDQRELGNWMLQIRLCLQIARAVRRMHAAGLAHSDLSYRNVLIDPSTGRACLIDIDGLVVPGKYPPDVVGTPDFIAPEQVDNAHEVDDRADEAVRRRFGPGVIRRAADAHQPEPAHVDVRTRTTPRARPPGGPVDRLEARLVAVASGLLHPRPHGV